MVGGAWMVKFSFTRSRHWIWAGGGWRWWRSNSLQIGGESSGRGRAG